MLIFKLSLNKIIKNKNYNNSLVKQCNKQNKKEKEKRMQTHTYTQI